MTSFPMTFTDLQGHFDYSRSDVAPNSRPILRYDSKAASCVVSMKQNSTDISAV